MGSLFAFPIRFRHAMDGVQLLYTVQGVPLGLTHGSVPFLLKEHISYTKMGVFSLAGYPYRLANSCVRACVCACVCVYVCVRACV